MNDSNGTGKRPLAVYAIIDRKERNYWLKVGAAFTNRDGSLTLYLDALPIGTNRLQVREQRAFEDVRAGNVNAPAPAVEEVHS